MIRKAEISDVAALRNIADKAYGIYAGRLKSPPLPLLIDYEKKIREGNTYVYEGMGEIHGMVTLVDAEDHLVLRNLAVLPASQGKGYGGLLINFVEREAKCRGFYEVHLWTREEMKENIKYYRAIGYCLNGRESLDGNRIVRFKKVLN